MGMNYYLLNKVKYSTWAPDQLGCNDQDLNVLCLKNGFVWNRQYYPTIDELNKDYYQRIHIGKSSAGWNFLLAIYPALGIVDIKDWIKLFKNPENKIVDEEDHEITPRELVTTITKRSAYHFDEYDSTEDYEAEQVRLTNKLNSSLAGLSISSGNPKVYTSYEDILRENHAVRGINGLLAHDPSANKYIIPGGKTATYDYINSVDFS